MTKKLNRRNFITSTAIGAAAISAAGAQEKDLIPKRVLGKTGGRISMLGFGGGSRFGMYESEDVALSVVNEAIDSGITYLDTAHEYGENGSSEKRYGQVLKYRRKEVWLTTKLPQRTYDDAMRAIEISLKRLQTDHLDLVHIHSLGDMADLAEIEKPNGVLKAVYEIREQKMARFVGMTSHTDAQTMKTAIERHDLDCVMMALNAATTHGQATGFERIALPAAKKKNLGVLAMKIAGQDLIIGSGVGKTGIRDLLFYSWSLPVAACIIGMPKRDMLRENIRLAKSYAGLSEAEKTRIRAKVEPSVAAFDHFLRNHQDEMHA